MHICVHIYGDIWIDTDMRIAVSYRELRSPDALGQHRARRCALSLSSAPKPNPAQPSLPDAPGRSRDEAPGNRRRTHLEAPVYDRQGHGERRGNGRDEPGREPGRAPG